MESFGKYLAAIRYRWKIALRVAVVIAAALAAVVWFLPNQYSATTTILVDPQKIPDRYVSTTVTEDPNERLNTLTQEVLSRTRLSEIVAKYHLYPRMIAKSGEDDVIAYLRTEIQIQIKRTSGAALSAFTITYRSDDRDKVARVTSQLAQSFIDWNLDKRQNQVEGTTKFLNDELEQAREKLKEEESRVRDYRLSHLGEMPEQMDANLQTLGHLQTEAQAKAEVLNRLDQERLVLMKDPSAASVALTGRPSPQAQLNVQVEEARRRLEQLNARYKPQHPDVLAAQDRLHELEAQLSRSPTSDPGGSSRGNVVSTDLSDRLHLLDQQKAQVIAQQAALEQQIRHYQRLVDAVPVREAEVSGLMRDYDSAKLNYQSLLEKTYSADMATELERKQQGERFQVLDPAITPDHPDSPNRPALWLASLLAGIAAGLGTAIGLDQFDGTVKTEQDLLALLPKSATILGHIPEIQPAATLPRRLAAGSFR